MAKMGVQALYHKPKHEQEASGAHGVSLPAARQEGRTRQRGLGQDLAITDIPMARGWADLAVLMNGASWLLLAHRVSGNIDKSFCLEALDEAFARHGRLEIFNIHKGSRFTGLAFTYALKSRGVAISMDGCGARRDIVFFERLWREIKYEEDLTNSRFR